MKIIINTSTLEGSGVTQVAVSFLYECLHSTVKNEYHVFLGNKVWEAIKKEDFDERFFFYDFFVKPVSFLKGGIGNVLKMKKLESVIEPDAVFSVFGPSYWTPKSPHLQGYAYPHYVYPDSPLFDKIGVLLKFKLGCYKLFHLNLLKRNGHYFVSETEDVSLRLKKIFGESYSYFTASNTYSSFFKNFKKNSNNNLLEVRSSKFRFLSLCTLQMHKNLDVLNYVIPYLLEKNRTNIEFVITISKEEMERTFIPEIWECIVPVGRIQPSLCPQLFRECDALFLPTLLECFSANYPEAMIMNKPIVTSNLSFATSVCQGAALYFDPLDYKDVGDKLIEICENEILRNRLIESGKDVVKNFLSSEERCNSYLKILSFISNKDE